MLLPFWVLCCQHFLHGAGWEKQLLGTDVAMGDDTAHKWTGSSPHSSPHAQHVSHVQSVGGTDRALSKITLVLSTPCRVGKREESFFRDYKAWVLCRTPLFTQGRRPEVKCPKTSNHRAPRQALQTVAVHLHLVCLKLLEFHPVCKSSHPISMNFACFRSLTLRA